MRIGDEVKELGGTLMLPGTVEDASSAAVHLVRGTVRIDEGRILTVELEPNAPLDPRRLVVPGLIDAHLHIPQFDSIGRDGLTLLDWLNGAIFPAEQRWEDTAYAAEMSARVARRLLSHGTTGVCAYGSVHHAATQAAIRSFGSSGIRGFVGQVLMDQQSPEELLRPAAQLLDEAARLVPAGRVVPIVSPRFAVSCSMDLMRGSARLAAERDWPVQTHLAETLPECELVERLHGLSYVDTYKHAGLLGPRTILAHAIWLSEVERRELEGWRCVIAHCPTANRFLSSGLFQGQRFRPLALGSDIAGGPDISMVRVARAAREVWLEGPQSQVVDAFGPEYWWWQITAGNAQALHWKDAGRIAPGAAADLVVIDAPDPAAPLPLGLGSLMYAWDERWVSVTLSEGRVAWTREC